MKISVPGSVVAVLLTALALSWAAAARADAPPKAKANAQAIQSWRADRFGMFIHWGPVSLTEKEISWSRANSNPNCPNQGPTPVNVYDNLYKQFDPSKFDARQWVAVAQAAGMRYMILTAKHCDGFLLWDSKVDDYNIMHTPFHRDVCAELARAAHEAGMKIGWYFSPMDWRDPDFRTGRNAAFVSRMQGELRELLGNYGKIDILWFDWDGHEPVYDQANTYALVKKLQPEIILTNRLDLGPGNSDRQILSPFADYYTPEQSIGGYDDQRPWESCLTISRRGQWAWGGPKDGVKTFAECSNMLIRCAGGDGNVLLNVGPTPTGEIAPEQVGRLKEIGAWLAKYGESIYGTRGGPFKPGRFGVSTRKGQTIYLHIQHWPGETLSLPAIPAKIVRGVALTGGAVTVKQTEDVIEVTLPARDRQEIDTVIGLELDRPAGTIAPVAARAGSPSLTTGKKATASNVYNNMAEHGPGMAVDGNGETRWATDSGTKSAWLEVDLGQPVAFGRAVIEQAYPELQRVRKFAIETWQDGKWQPCYRGENLGATLDATFPPITVQRVRLNITEATDGPTIWEFELYPPKK
jgi:alpha-L-fucosidase